MTPDAIAAELGLRDPDISPLSGGLSNQSWRIRDERQDLVLRLSGAAAGELGADGRLEQAMIRLAAAAGLAPELVLARPDEGVLVTQYVSGQVLTRNDAVEPLMLARIGAWLAKLHSLDPPRGFAAIDFGERAAAYLGILRSRAPRPYLLGLQNRLIEKRNALPPPRLVACHHDLHRLNLVDRGDALVAFDWEYAGPGDPAADLAACIGYHDLAPAQVETLLAGYGGGANALRPRLAPLCWIFDCLWLGWMETAATLGISPDDRRRHRLLERLSS